MLSKRIFIYAAALAAATFFAPITHAKNQPIQLLVGFAAGGSTDRLARILAEKLGTELGETVLVVNKPGAAGRLVMQAAKTAAADGSTFVLAVNSVPIYNAILFSPKELQYDLEKDFTPVAIVATYPVGIATHSGTGIKNAKDFIEWAKKNPDQAMFGTSGLAGRFAGLGMAKAAGVDLTVVPYKGSASVITDLIGGQIPLGVATIGDFKAYEKSGKIHPIGIFGAHRSPLAPEIPTFMEQGVKFDLGTAWIGMWSRSETPKTANSRMEAALKKVLESPETIEMMASKLAMQPYFHSSADAKKMQDKEKILWTPIIKSSGYVP